MEKVFYFHKNNHINNNAKSAFLTYWNIKKPKLPSYTIAAIYDESLKQFKFGISKCSVKDQFNKKIGRVIAKGRAEKYPIIINITIGEIKNNKLGTCFLNKSLELLEKNNVS